MPMLRKGYGAVKNLRCKSGARFPPSTGLRGFATIYVPRGFGNGVA